MSVVGSVDDWEAKESGWLETAKVLTHMTTYAKQKYSGKGAFSVITLCVVGVQPTVCFLTHCQMPVLRKIKYKLSELKPQ